MKKLPILLAAWMIANLALYLFFIESAYKVSWGMFFTFLLASLFTALFILVYLLVSVIRKALKRDTDIPRRLKASPLSLVIFLSLLLLQIVVSEQFIHVPGDNSLNSIESVEINGTTQYISVRSTDETNPVLLFLAGGPGGSQMQATREHFSTLEDHFTIINWEQPGSGKSYGQGRLIH